MIYLCSEFSYPGSIQLWRDRPPSRVPVKQQSVDIPPFYSHYKDIFCPNKLSVTPTPTIGLCNRPHNMWANTPWEKKNPLYQNKRPWRSMWKRPSRKGTSIHPLSLLTFCYPLPLVPAALELRRGATVFTKLDLRSTCSLIMMQKGDKCKTAFVTHTGHYGYCIILYSLVNGPTVFQGYMNEVLQEYLHHFFLVYIDTLYIPGTWLKIVNTLLWCWKSYVNSICISRRRSTHSTKPPPIS